MGVDETRRNEFGPVVVHARPGISGAQIGGLADSGDVGAFDGHGTVSDDARGGRPFGEGVTGVAEDLAQDQIGHAAPREPVQPRGFPPGGKFSSC